MVCVELFLMSCCGLLLVLVCRSVPIWLFCVLSPRLLQQTDKTIAPPTPSVLWKSALPWDATYVLYLPDSCVYCLFEPRFLLWWYSDAFSHSVSVVSSQSQFTTGVKTDCLNCVWEKVYSFDYMQMTKEQFEHEKLGFKIYDKNHFLRNQVIGAFLHHQFWLECVETRLFPFIIFFRTTSHLHCHYIYPFPSRQDHMNAT